MRRNFPSVIAGVALVVILLVYAMTYQVRFTEVAIETTFGKPSAPIEKAGLGFKWPWPIQGVVKYDKRIRILDSPEEEAQTRDRQILIMTTFCGWRIKDPGAFLRKVENVREAEDRIRKHLRSEIGAAVGQHDFGQFVSTNPQELKLAQIEDEIKKGVAERVSQYGITVDLLGIRRISLPQSTTEKVFGQMRAERTAMAEKTKSEGEATARRIRSRAESARNQILSFAASKAQQIRAEGAAAAADEYKVFSEDEDFASFLRTLEFMEKVFEKRTIFFLDASIPGIQMLKEDRPILGKDQKLAVPRSVPTTQSGRATSVPAARSERARDAAIQEPKQ
jgi:modulator of FtsH protease HflC